MATPNRLEQVSLLGLGGQSRAGAAALHIEDHQRQFGHYRQSDGLAFQGHSRPAGTGGGQGPTVGRTDHGTHRSYLIFGLKYLYTHILTFNQFMKNLTGRRNRVGNVRKLLVGPMGGGNQP